jgi:PucR C-terminal helix-turn-helix domain
MEAESDRLLALAAERLRVRTDDLVARQMRVLRTIRSYDRVPDDDLLRSCRRNVERVVTTLERQDALPAHIDEDELASGRRRALQGVPSDDVAEAYRAVLAVLRDAFIEEATAVSADSWTVLAATRRLWDLTDRYTGVLVSARQQVEIDDARRDERRRMALLQRLLTGAVDAAELVTGGAVRSALPDAEYWVVRGRPQNGDVQQLTQHLEAGRRRTLVAPVDDDVVGLSPVRPKPLSGAVIAVAGPASLVAVPQAFAEAGQLLVVALRYGRTGVVDSSSLSVRVAVEQQTELGEQLFRRYVADLDETAAGRDLLGTVRTYLANRRSIATTARALTVHENTVRYRLDRFRRLTGADLSDTDVLVEVWWALQRAESRLSQERERGGRSA